MNHVRILIHPTAAERPDFQSALESVREQGHSVEVEHCEGPEALVRGAEAAAEDGVEVVVAAGGDGTLGRVATGVVRSGASMDMGVLPMGTGNDFAHCADLPVDDLEACLEIALEGRAHRVDAGRVGDELFVNMASGGFATRATAEVPPEAKRLLGQVSYLLSGLGTLTEVTPLPATVRMPGFTWEGPLLGIAVGLGRRAGGGVPACPGAILDDGLFDVTLVPDLGAGSRMALLKALVAGGPEALGDDVVEERVPWVELSASGGINVNLDGEPRAGESFRFEVVPGALSIRLGPDAPVEASDGADTAGRDTTETEKERPDDGASA